MNTRKHGPGKLTFVEAKDLLRKKGMALTKDTIASGPTGSGEYRVTFKLDRLTWPKMTRERAERLAYYTENLEDALQSGLDMAKREKRTPEELDDVVNFMLTGDLDLLNKINS